ncbi:LysR family transcriptional regulator [Paraburkholderia hospita]|uniref:LysR family transcriptional regulator n=1 Tax=Paraburkholderia hospita TaxID=169430 RepID=UPI000271BF26|nr:LysR family transcriptional regulator [Paraburkholderia hospita]EUC14435.1 transcriptional regulator, LysR family [Burkholderia sp. BT03]SKC93681.1 DNA-binding transcriptional regulator, LysR family [Paraburkholderia hospita]
MDMLQAIRAFAQVASVGSFTTAAQELGVVTSAVSRSIADLEAHLNIRLLHRTTRRVALTEAGERYLSHCQVILKHLAQAEAEAFGTNAEPSGTLKIGVTASFDRYHLPDLISGYLERFPQVSVSVILAQQGKEAMRSDHDVLLLCSSVPPDPRITFESLGAMSSILCASPVYLARYGVPQTLHDLKQHRCIDLAGDQSAGQWIFDGPFGHEACSVSRTALQSDLCDVLNDSIQAGLGIGPLPVRIGLQQLRAGSVVRVLPDYRMKARNVYVLYSSPLNLDRKIRTWVEFLREALPQRLARDEAAFAPLVAALPGDSGDDTQSRAIQDHL